MQSIGKDVWQGDDGAPRCLSLYTSNHASRRHKVQGLSEEKEKAKWKRPRYLRSIWDSIIKSPIPFLGVDGTIKKGEEHVTEIDLLPLGAESFLREIIPG